MTQSATDSIPRGAWNEKDITMKIFLFTFFLMLIWLSLSTCGQQNGQRPPNAAQEMNIARTAPLASADTIVYQMATFEKKVGDCQGGKSGCAVVTIKYPQIVGAASLPIQNALSNLKREYLFTPVYSGSNEKKVSINSAEAFAADFFDEFQSMMKESPGYVSAWEIERKMTVIDNNPPLMCLEISTYAYTGGAHPNSNTVYVNVDTRTGKRIALQDIFNTNFGEKLRPIAERYFREQCKIPEGKRWSDLGFFFENDRFELNDNFILGKSGITFYFNPYEIAPYAFGVMKCFIPYKDIRNLIKKNPFIRFSNS